MRKAMIWLPLAATFLLAGCTADEYAVQNEYVPYGGSSNHPITLAKGPVTLNVTTTKSGLQPSQINAVSAFARQASASGLTPVTVSRPSGGGHATRNASQIANLLAEQGVPSRLIKTKVYSGSSMSPVKVSFTRAYAKTEPCGDWSRDATQTRSNEMSPNHGCAVQANIAAMIANPNDLEVPGAMGPVNSSIRSPDYASPAGGGGASPSTPAASATP